MGKDFELAVLRRHVSGAGSSPRRAICTRSIFGKPTSDIVYSQLAEGVREALRPAPRTRLHSPTVLPFHLSAFCCAIVASL